MSGFGGRPVRGSEGFHAIVEGALAEERANTLGRTGRRLDEAIDDHRLLIEVGTATPDQVDLALNAIARAVWTLMVQRECSGFRVDSIGWVRKHYAIPPEVLRRI